MGQQLWDPEDGGWQAATKMKHSSPSLSPLYEAKALFVNFKVARLVGHIVSFKRSPVLDLKKASEIRTIVV